MQKIRPPHGFWWLSVATILVTSSNLLGQGALTPSGPPAPTQKSLQEIWDKFGTMEAQVVALQTQNADLQENVTALNASALEQQRFLATMFQDQLTWELTTVDSAGETGYYTSLAFGPNGQPAISYFDAGNADLRFTRFNGVTWTLALVDSVGTTGFHPSLAFGPDLQPAISYDFVTLGDLRFARYDGGVWKDKTVDSLDATGSYTSLAFGPDGQPAISYFDDTTADLRFARRTIRTP